MEEDMREKYESLALAELRAIAKSRGMKGVTTMKKADLIELMLAEDEKDKAAGRDVTPKPVLRGPREPREDKQEERFPSELDSGVSANGILEVMPCLKLRG